MSERLNNKEPFEKPAFEKLTLRQLKDYVQNRDVPISGYNKSELIILANAVYSTS